MTRERIRNRRDRSEHGIVLVYFSMLLIVLIVSSALVVDLGSWYVRIQHIQGAADAASLAGAAYLPGEATNGINAALAAAAKNGFTDGANGGTIHVSASVVTGYPNRMQVTVKDDKLTQYFSKVFYNGTSAARSAVAEHVPGLPMGSPENGFGMGDLYGSNPNNYWAAVNGWCAPREQGDLVSSNSDGEYVHGAWDCNTTTSPDTYANSYDNGGYTYDIEVPQVHAAIAVEVYDAAYVPYWYSYTPASGRTAAYYTQNDCGGPDAAISPALDNNSYAMETDFALSKPDGTLMTTKAFPSNEGGPNTSIHGSSANCKTWSTIGTIAASDPGGTYSLTVASKQGEADSFGVNGFAMEAVPIVSGVPNHLYRCSTITTASNYNAGCAQVHGDEMMSLYANIVGTTGSFYLTKLDGTHSSTYLTINLWDPGEGASSIQILNNQGAAVPFTYTVNPCTGLSTCSGSISASGSGLSVSGTGTQPGSNRLGNGKYNDRMLTLLVAIPSNYSATAATNGGWWSIKYNLSSSGSVTDRTTWKVSSTGHPIHLVS